MSMIFKTETRVQVRGGSYIRIHDHKGVRWVQDSESKGPRHLPAEEGASLERSFLAEVGDRPFREIDGALSA